MYPVTGRPYLSPLLHVLTWLLLAFILLFYHPLSWNINLPYQFWIKQAFILGILVSIFYANSYILVPQLLLKNRNTGYIAVCFAILLLTGPLVKMLDEYLQLQILMNKAFMALGVAAPPKRADKLDLFLMMMIALIIGISTSITLIQKWQGEQKSQEELKKEKIVSELSFLKAQINPHFFFNTLNNIYALTHVDVLQSRIALHKLSRMMRYLLYDTQAGITPLSKEIAFIEDYLDLMKIRLNETTTVIFSPPQISVDFPIAPMLFLPYIENAFKHGVSSVEHAEIHIAFELQGTMLHMLVKNIVFSQQGGTADEYGGIGLTNTRRRLELLYPEKHTCSSEEKAETGEFIVNLTLNLDDTKMHSGR